MDEETVLVAGYDGAGPLAGVTQIYKTDRHGTRPWDAFPIMGACCGIDFDLSPNIATDGSVLMGDVCGQVFISENIGSTWDEIIDAVAAPFASYNTYVQFDPGYGTSGDPGETMVYAAAGTNIARCNIDPEALWKLQDWEVIYSALCLASGIDAHGDTALYVSDAGIIGDPTPREVYIAYGSSIEMLCLGCDPWCGPGDLGGPYSVWDLSYEVY